GALAVPGRARRRGRSQGSHDSNLPRVGAGHHAELRHACGDYFVAALPWIGGRAGARVVWVVSAERVRSGLHGMMSQAVRLRASFFAVGESKTAGGAPQTTLDLKHVHNWELIMIAKKRTNLQDRIRAALADDPGTNLTSLAIVMVEQAMNFRHD